MQYQSKKIISALWCAVVAGGLSIALIQPSSAQGTATPAKASTPAGNTVVATVNNDKILMSSVTVVLDKIKRQANVPQADLDRMRNEIVEDLITERLLVNEAKRLKLMPTTEKIDEAIWQIKRQFSSPKAFEDELKISGKNEEALRLIIAEGMASDALSKKITEDIVVTDDEAAKYYNEHKTEFLVPELVHVRHIQISFPLERKEGKVSVKALTKDEKTALQQKAQAILKKATAANADFPALAKANSQDIVSKPIGGDLGFIASDDIVDKSFRDVAFSSPSGKVYPKVVETKFGFNIIKVEEKKASRTLTLAEVAPKIKQRLSQIKYKERLDAKVAELRKSAKITNTLAQSTP